LTDIPKVTNREAVSILLAVNVMLDRMIKDGKITAEESITYSNVAVDASEELLSGGQVYLGDVKPNCPVCGVDLEHPVAGVFQYTLDNTVRMAQEKQNKTLGLPSPNAPSTESVS